MQHIFLVGNIGTEPIYLDKKEGQAPQMIRFRVACNRAKVTTWYTIVAPYREKLMPYLVKGRQIAVHGNLSVKVWEGYLDASVYADELTLCGGVEEKEEEKAEQ